VSDVLGSEAAALSEPATTTTAPVRRRPPPRPVEVVAVTRLTPRLVSLHVGGPALQGFAVEAPTAHIKVFLPQPGADLVLPTVGPNGPVLPEGAPPPIVRTYTPRHYDAASNTLEIQFVLHGEGAASRWAAGAKPGDQLAVAGPGGRFRLDPTATEWWIAGDESAIPAAATLLEALPATARAEVHFEVDGGEDELPLTSSARVSVHWHRRRPMARQKTWGTELRDAATNARLSEGTYVWVGCEASTMRAIRMQMLERGVARDALTTRGYWRVGEVNHPDHDYGDD
jgi:NADPH-dependent ferric siderophore reductase